MRVRWPLRLEDRIVQSRKHHIFGLVDETLTKRSISLKIVEGMAHVSVSGKYDRLKPLVRVIHLLDPFTPVKVQMQR